MKRLSGVSILAFAINFCCAQNLVPNPSFENYISCPTALNQISVCQDWYNFGYVPDYFNACASNPQVSVPYNYFGYQVPVSGNAYAAFMNVHVPGPAALRDLIGAQLLQPLIIGQKYFVSLHLCRPMGLCATNKMGVRFSTVPFDSLQPPQIDDFAHVYTDTIVTDSVNWFKITGSFIADSNYSYITIGNFFMNPATNTFCGNIWSNWYYVDDVCVSTDSMTCYYPIGIQEPSVNNIELFPNPATNELRIKNIELRVEKMEIYNLFGKKVFSEQLVLLSSRRGDERGEVINVSQLPPGIYFIVVTDREKKSVIRRFVKM